MAQRVACVVGVLGAPLTGKGLLAHRWIARPHPLKLVWSAVEKSDNYAGLLGVSPLTSIPALSAALVGDARAVVFVPSLDRDAMLIQFDKFCRVAWACDGARVLVEELSRVTAPSWAPPAWKNLTTSGSHQGLEVMATAQRPAQVDKDFLGSCTEIRCYRMNEKPDADRVCQTLIEATPAQLMALPDRHYWHLWRSPRRVEQGIQPAPGEKKSRRRKA
jgi:hypothetical protein